MTLCLHKQADHACGTNARFVLDRCRCDDCHTAHNDYERRRRQWLGGFPREAPPLVDAEPVREHVQELVWSGMGLKRIAKVSGVSHGALSKLIYGDYGRDMPPSRRVRRETAERLLATESNVSDGARVNGREARRIVRELLARGWWKAEIGRRVHGPEAVSLQLHGKKVFAGTLRTLRQLLTEPVPLRKHPRWGTLYNSDTGHRRPIAATTPGVPEETLPMRGVLACEVCSIPFSDHPARACWRVMLEVVDSVEVDSVLD